MKKLVFILLAGFTLLISSYIPQSYAATPVFIDQGDGTIADIANNLVWLKKADCFPKQTWDAAMSSAYNLGNGQCGLADGSTAGDWRLAKIEELNSLIVGRLEAADLNAKGFTSVLADTYWSSTDYFNGSAGAADMGVGFAGNTSKTNLYYGWPVRYLKRNPVLVDRGNGTIADTANNLLWLKNANCFGTKDWNAAKTSAGTLGSGQCGLTDGSVAGDWHLPTIDELTIFTDFNLLSTQLNASGFTNVQPSGYWSSDNYSSATSAALNDMSVGFAGNASITNPYYVWPVRYLYKNPVLENRGDGTIVDTANNLVWLKNANCFGAQNWGAAYSSANNLASGQCGLTDGSTSSDWHLPTMEELTIFTDFNLFATNLNTAGFTNVQSNVYWSSTKVTDTSAAVDDMTNGFLGNTSTSNSYFAWPVRYPAIPARLPAATTGTASAISTNGATLNGTVTANSASTAVTFEYGLTAGYGSTATAAQSPLVHTASNIPVSATIAGLACNTTYHFRVKGVNGAGTTNGTDTTLTTGACITTSPAVTTGGASAITAAGATFNGTVTANGASTVVTFDYGLTTSYGSTVTAPQSPLGANASNASVSAVITGLSCGTPYHFRVKGVNSAGTTNGNDGIFSTSACPITPPAATTENTSSVTATWATLNGTVTANGAPTTVTFEYGLTTSYGSTATTPQNPLASNSNNTFVSATITGLTCDSTYHFRVKGVNSAGTTNGNDGTFVTGECHTIWQQTSGPEGGTIFSLVIDPSTPQTLYAGTDGGVFKSTNGGNSWSLVNNGLTKTDVRALAIDPAVPQTIYAGTMEGGVFKSTNCGASWIQINNGLTSTDVDALAIDPSNPQTIYAGAESYGGVFKSTDGGSSWSQAGMIANTMVFALAIDPVTPQIIYAGTYDGLFKSTDHGTSWSLTSSGMSDIRVLRLAIDPVSPQTLYANTYGDKVYKSTDGAISWNPVDFGVVANHQAGMPAIDPTNPQILYAISSQGVIKSTNGGASWSAIYSGFYYRGYRSLVIDPSFPQTIYAGMNASGVYKSTDGGTSWNMINNGLKNMSIYSLVSDPSSPQTVYAGTQAGVFQSASGGVFWGISANTDQAYGYWDSTFLAMDPFNSQILYLGSNSYGMYKSTNSGASWNYCLPGKFTQAIAINPVNPQTLYVGIYEGGVYKSIDGGNSWSIVNNGLTSASVFALAIDPSAPQTIYAGTMLGGVSKSTNGGTSWSVVSNGLPNYTFVRSIVIDPTTPQTLYVGTWGRGVFKSTNGGSTWSAVNSGLGEQAVYKLSIDPANPKILYAATYNGGVFKSSNYGGSWSAFNSGLTSLEVHDLVYNPSDYTLYAGTRHGGVFKAKAIPDSSNIEVQVPTEAGKLTITWTRPVSSSSLHAHIYRSTILGQLGSLVGDNITAISFTDTGLASQTKFYYTVRGVDNIGNESTNIVQVSGTTLDATPPAVPGNQSAIFAGPTPSITLSWTKPANADFSHIHIYRSTASGTLGTLTYDAITTSPKTDTGLANGTTYYYTIRAVDKLGNETTNINQVSAQVSVATSGDPTFVITNLVITKPATGEALTLNWTNPTGLSKLELYRSNISGEQGTLVYTGTETTFTDTGLVPRSTYYYTFVLYNAQNQITTMSQQDAYPDETSPPLPVTGLKAILKDTAKVQLDWLRSPSKDTIAYDILWDNGDGNKLPEEFITVASINNPNTQTWTSDSLTSDVTCRFAVKSVDDTIRTSSVFVGVTPVDSVNSLVSAMVTSPAAGAKVYGNSVTLTAGMAAGQQSDASEVQFKYRRKGTIPWIDIGSADTSPPFSTNWNVTALAEGDGDYELIATATAKASSTVDPNPSVTIVVRTASDATITENNDGAVQTATVPVYTTAPATLTTQTPAGAAKVSLPSGAVTSDTQITVSVPSPATVNQIVPAGYVNTSLYIDVSFGNNQHDIGGSAPATIEIPYLDANDDNIKDDTALNVYDMRIFDYNGTSWKELPTFVDKTRKIIYATTSTFSLFAALVPPSITFTSGYNMVSVPLTLASATPSSVFGSYTLIYDPVSQAFVKPATIQTGKGYFVWSGNNRTLTPLGTETVTPTFSIPIKKGWNMIGNPYKGKVPVQSLTLNCGTPKSITQSELAGEIAGTFFHAINGAYELATTQNATDTIDPWKGYWLLSDKDCNLIFTKP